MNQETKNILYDRTLDIEAYIFIGIEQPFPDHFHNYYVIGAVENGSRTLKCNDKHCLIKKNDMIIFNPNDNHGCKNAGKDSFIYKGLNISVETMRKVVNEITGKLFSPVFTENVICCNEIYNTFLK
ncbi:MAG: AraC family ligand binding domain-containing protein, partial [Eubacterium sp.]|nr:AraC family ligand binding domain-containing protein [Eubacterium sp.]